jgi:tetratricopeptide (TPR) repeat protein
MRYETVRLLGRGATAETFLCRDLYRAGRLVARKVFDPSWAAERPERIDRELETLAGLAHPSIAAVEDFGEEDGRVYLVSEFVDGKDFLKAARGLDVHQTVRLILEVLEALDYLYFRNVVHLDLKPENLLVRESAARGREVALIDFGLAAHAGAGKESAGEAVGTPPFTAPEFALRRSVDTRSDLYSVGVLFYAALCGRLPFEGTDPVSVLNLQLSRDPDPPASTAPGIGPPLSNFLLRLLRRDPKKRPESPRAALEELKSVLGETAPTARRTPVPLFENPDFLFRERLSRDLMDNLLNRGGLWVVHGAEGSGKTFLARWLERRFWALQRKVLRLDGKLLVLEDPNLPKGNLLLIDDADQGPTLAWLQRVPAETPVVLFARSLSHLAPEPDRVVTLEGNPRAIIRQGRALARAKEPGGIAEPATVLRSFLQESRVSLDAETLGVWTGWSVAEVEEAVQESLRLGLIERRVSGGRVFYRADGASEGQTPESGLVPPVDPNAFFQKLHDEGRYEEGLALFERFYGGVPPDGLTLAKARLAAGAGRHAEVRTLLAPEVLERLDAKDLASAYETLGKSALFDGRSPEDRDMLGRAVALATRHQDADTLSRALLHLGVLAQRLGDFRGAEGFYRHALAAAREAPAADLLTGAVLLNLANLHFDGAHWEKAENYYEECLPPLKRAHHDAVTAQALLNLANLSFYQGRRIKAEGLAREALRLAIPRRYLPTQGRALLLLSMIDGDCGRRDRQGERLSEAVFVLEEAGQTFERIVALIHRAYFYESEGRFGPAEADARLAQALARRSRADDLEKQAGLILAKVLARDAANDTEAWDLLEKACRHFSRGRNAQMSWECEFECGEFLRARGCPAEARSCYERALETVDDLALRLSPDAREAFLRDGKRDKIQGRLA